MATLTSVRQALAAAKSSFACHHDRLGAVPRTELSEDVRHVVADGLRRQDELVGDLRIRLATSEEVEDLALPRGQLWERADTDRPGRGQV